MNPAKPALVNVSTVLTRDAPLLTVCAGAVVVAVATAPASLLAFVDLAMLGCDERLETGLARKAMSIRPSATGVFAMRRPDRAGNDPPATSVGAFPSRLAA